MCPFCVPIHKERREREKKKKKGFTIEGVLLAHPRATRGHPQTIRCQYMIEDPLDQSKKKLRYTPQDGSWMLEGILLPRNRKGNLRDVYIE